ncbi:unnamed protein product, partial [marine sediment metagenome]
MPDLTIRATDLHARARAVGRILRPLRGNREVPCTVYGPPVRRGKAIAAHSGGVGESYFKAWLFASCVRDIVCRYHEIWVPHDNSASLLLIQSYLTILWQNRAKRDLEQVVCVHCEP